MINDIINLLDLYTPEILVISGGLLLITLTLFMWVWVLNRRHYHNLKHQIPAGIVKNYLDSIIQNSQSLKSSLFRGGGVDVDLTSLPQVLSPSSLPGNGHQLDVGGGVSQNELNQKLAEISSLNAQLTSARSAQAGLESELAKVKESLKLAEAKAKDAGASAPKAGGDGALKSDLARVTKERDELIEKLKEYEIIEDDLANLKRLQQENTQLKKALEGVGGATIPMTAPTPSAPVVSAEVIAESENLESLLNHETEDGDKLNQEELDKLVNEIAPPVDVVDPAPAAAAPVAAKTEGGSSEKSAEDLLSEFEKMLG